ncbi:MAG: type II toxin-antitoxin system VapC family toxin [Anaerolineae bacterium]
MKRRFMLDAWAMLALLQGEEPAASRVKQLLSDTRDEDIECFISIINLGEVLYRVGRVKGEQEAWQTLDQMRRLPLTVVPAEEGAVFAAAGLKMHHTISYADAFAAAATDELDAVLVTGDPELEQLENRIQIEMLERAGR